jgi:hypothetical protein
MSAFAGPVCQPSNEILRQRWNQCCHLVRESTKRFTIAREWLAGAPWRMRIGTKLESHWQQRWCQKWKIPWCEYCHGIRSVSRNISNNGEILRWCPYSNHTHISVLTQKGITHTLFNDELVPLTLFCLSWRFGILLRSSLLWSVLQVALEVMQSTPVWDNFSWFDCKMTLGY